MTGAEAAPASAPRAPVLVIGVGRPDAGDDAVGPAVARRVREALDAPGAPWGPEAVAVLERDGEGTALLAAWEEAAAVVLVDAVRSGAPAGSIHRIEAGERPLPAALRQPSTHAFGVADAVELARALGRLPGRLVVYGIEGNDFRAGARMSSEVDAAVGPAADRILDEVARLAPREGSP